MASAISSLVTQVHRTFDKQYIFQFDLIADMFWISQ